jgi:hypothetical protein
MNPATPASGMIEESNQATPPAAPPVNRLRTPLGALPNIPRTILATMNEANKANIQSPPPFPSLARLSLTGAGKGSPSISLISWAVASAIPPP